MLLAEALRPATRDDVPEVVHIYNEGIEGRNATFEMRLRTSDDIFPWLDQGLTFLVAQESAGLAGYAVGFPYSPRECYRGVTEASVYVSSPSQGRGVGTLLMEHLLSQLEAQGTHKVLAKVFVENHASLSLFRKIGFATVGIHHSHAQLDGVWRDVVLLEKLIKRNLS